MASFVQFPVEENDSTIPSAPPCAKPCTWGGQIASVGFSLWSNLKVGSRVMVSSFTFHFAVPLLGWCCPSCIQNSIASAGQFGTQVSQVLPGQLGPTLRKWGGEADSLCEIFISLTSESLSLLVPPVTKQIRKAHITGLDNFQPVWMPSFDLKMTLSKHLVNYTSDMFGLYSGWSGSTNVINVHLLLEFFCCLGELILWHFG